MKRRKGSFIDSHNTICDLSIWNARAAGISAAEISEGLRRYSKYQANQGKIYIDSTILRLVHGNYPFSYKAKLE